MMVKDLKYYLRRFGQFWTGNKPELIEWVKCVSKLKLADKMIVEMKENAGKEARTETLTTPLGELVPEPNGPGNGSKEVSFIPDICVNVIYNYLVLQKGARRQHKSE